MTDHERKMTADNTNASVYWMDRCNEAEANLATAMRALDARMDLRVSERLRVLDEAILCVSEAMDDNPIQFRCGLSEAVAALEELRDRAVAAQEQP